MMIEELLQDFDRYAKESQGHLTEMLATISTGRVPSRTDVSQLDLSIASLRAKYDCIYQSASEQLSADEMPSDDAPAAAFAEAVRNSKTVRLRALMEQAKSCLQQFLSVRSLVDAYANALRPYQEQAQSVLQSLEENRNLDSEALQEAASGPQALLAAIACADKDTEEGMELCDRVAAFYPGRIYGGVVANKYYLEKKADGNRQGTTTYD